MNTKLLAGISLAAMAGSFWACGEGQINGKEFSDTIVESMYDTPEALESLKEQAKTDCWQNDPACAAMYGSYVDPNASNPVVSSAAVIMSSSSIYQPLPGVSSSSESIGNANKRSSSSGLVFASSGLEESSSSEASKPVTGLGSCYPVTTPIKKGGSTTWKFKGNLNSGYRTEFTEATYQWNFGDDAVPAEATVMKNVSSDAVTYAVAGLKTASVTVTMPDGASELVTCDALQVDGNPITDCVCAPTSGKSLNIEKSAIATWEVTGCKTESLPLTYEWETGIAGDGANGGYQFTEAGTKAPVVTVHNTDNTAIKVTCDPVKATVGQEYEFRITGNQIKADPLMVENGGCMLVTGSWTDQWNAPSFKILCDGTALDQSVGMTFSMTYNNKEIATATGSWGFSNAGSEIGKVQQGEFSFENICVTFTGAETVKCSISQ